MTRGWGQNQRDAVVAAAMVLTATWGSAAGATDGAAAGPWVAGPAEPVPANLNGAPVATDAWYTLLNRPHQWVEGGSGWKQWMRSLWFTQTRRVAPDQSAARLRHQAWDRFAAAERTPSGAGWFTIGPSTLSGRCTSIAFDPSNTDIIYVGSAGGGVWKSLDGGDSWSPLSDHLPPLAVGALAVLPSDPDVVLMGTGEANGVPNAGGNGDVFGAGLFKSTDGGATWAPTSLSYGPGQGHGFGEIAVEPTTGVILAGAVDGCWRSTDDGDTWTLVEAGGNIYDVAWKPGDPHVAYIAKGRDPWQNFGSDNGVKVSTDAGQSFALAGTGQPAGSSIGNTEIAVTPLDPEVIYAVYVQTGTGMTLGLYRSTDGGSSWEARDTTTNMTNSQGWYDLALGVDPDNPERLLIGGVQLYRSLTGGGSYIVVPPSNGTATRPHVDFHDIVWEPGSTTNVWVACDGGVWRSTDDGVFWQSRREGLVTYQFYDICAAQADNHTTWGGMQDNGVTGRTSSSTVWADPPVVGDGGVCNVTTSSPSTVYAEVQFGDHRKTTNSGQSWFPINTGIVGSSPFIAATDLDANNSNHLYTCANNGMYRTTNGGASWQNVASHTARWISISQTSSDLVWTVSNFFGVWRTTNDGASWIQSTTFPNNGLETKIHAHPTEPATAIVTYGGYGTGLAHVLVTTNSGTSWSDATGDLPDVPVNAVVVDPDVPAHWFVGTDVGVWRSTDRGATWVPFGQGLPGVVVTDLEIRRGARKLVAGTYGRGAWEIDLTGPAAVGEGSAPTARHLLLEQPSPNPVGDTVWLRFAARAAGPVELAIYEASGRLVKRVASLTRGDAIVRNVAWSPAGQPPGVYFAELRAGGERLSRKIVVAR